MRFPELDDVWQPKIAKRIRKMGRFNDEALDDAVLRLSHGLTRERELAGTDYLSRRDLHAAYLDFFWPGTYAQTRFVLGQVDAPVLGDVLDLGCGTGASAAAILDAGATTVHGIDWSEDALDSARAIVDKNASFEREDLMDFVPRGSYDTIVLSHVVNELWRGDEDAVAQRADLLQRLAGNLREGGRIVILEPALRETSRQTLELRDALVADGLYIHSPCIWAGACPALAAYDWCHAAWHYEPPAHVAERSEFVGLRRDIAKTTYLVISRDAPAEVEGCVARVISTPLHSKGRFKYVVCGTEGRFGLTLLQRHVDEHNAAFKRLERGTVFRYGAHITKGDGERLDADANIDVLAGPTDPYP